MLSRYKEHSTEVLVHTSRSSLLLARICRSSTPSQKWSLLHSALVQVLQRARKSQGIKNPDTDLAAARDPRSELAVPRQRSPWLLDVAPFPSIDGRALLTLLVRRSANYTARASNPGTTHTGSLSVQRLRRYRCIVSGPKIASRMPHDTNTQSTWSNVALPCIRPRTDDVSGNRIIELMPMTDISVTGSACGRTGVSST